MQGWHLRERRSPLPVVSVLKWNCWNAATETPWNQASGWNWSLFQKEKSLKIIIFCIISWSQPLGKPPKSILPSTATDGKASSEQCNCWTPVLLQLGARDKLTLFPTTGMCRNPQTHPLIFLFPCTKVFSFVACESTCKNDSRAHSSLLNWEPN